MSLVSEQRRPLARLVISEALLTPTVPAKLEDLAQPPSSAHTHTICQSRHSSTWEGVGVPSGRRCDWSLQHTVQSDPLGQCANCTRIEESGAMGFHGFRAISAQSYNAAQDSSSRPSHPMITDISYTWWRCVTFICESRVLKASAGTFMTRY